MKVVIIGGGVAGFHAAEFIKKKNPDAKITVFTKETEGYCSTCGIPLVLGGELTFENIIVHPPHYYEQAGIDLKMGEEVSSIGLDSKQVTARNERVEYDYLVIATGRKPVIPKISGCELGGVYTLSNLSDARKVKSVLDGAKNAVVIGGGVIGLEAAAAFAPLGIKTTVVERLPSLLPSVIDEDMAPIVQKRLESTGVRVILNSSVQSINGAEKVESVTAGYNLIPADFVLVTTGVSPNADLAKRAGIETGQKGGIIVDAAMHVKRGRFMHDVYALGDCVEVRDEITKKPALSPFASTSALQARVIAENIGGNRVAFETYLSPMVCVIAGLQVGSVGATTYLAKDACISPVIGKAEGLTRARYCEGKKIYIKLLFDRETLVGAQAVSEEDVKERINLLSLAIKKKMNMDDLLWAERCFTPHLSLLVDPVLKAIENAKGVK